MRPHRLTLMVSLLTGASLVQAAPPAFQDARAFAMGGTGVAAGRPASASFFNPALLSIWHRESQDDLSVTAPSLNARVADKEDVIDQVDGIQDAINAFNDAVNRYNAAPSMDGEAVKRSARDLQDQLRAISGDAMRADIGLGLAIQKPGQTLGIGVFADATLRANVRGNFDPADDLLLDNIIAAADANLAVGNIDSGDQDGYELQSSGEVMAVAMAEVGVTLSHAFELRDSTLALGVSPKFVELRTFAYRQGIGDFDQDDFDAGEHETSESGFNVDLGAAYTFGDTQQWIVGAAVRNLVPMDIDTVNGTTVEVEPQVTVGLAHRSDWHTITADLDLTKNQAFSFEDDTQWVAVGGELDVFDLLQIRAGVRHNIASNDDASDSAVQKTQYTAGLALSPLGTRLEISGMLADGEYGAAVELGLMF